MSAAASGVLEAVVHGAAEATGAAGVALVALRDEELRVLAIGGDRDGRAPGEVVVPGDGPLGYVLASGQPLSLSPGADEATLCVPCLGPEGVLGALELRGAQPFTPEASRLAALFADVAAAALQESGLATESGPSPAELAAELARLAEADPARYAAMASVIGALLAHG
jgi:hypothetical protein